MFAFFSGNTYLLIAQFSASFSVEYDWYTTGLQCSSYLCDQVSLWTEEFWATVFKIRPQKMSHCWSLTLEWVLAKLDEEFKSLEGGIHGPQSWWWCVHEQRRCWLVCYGFLPARINFAANKQWAHKWRSRQIFYDNFSVGITHFAKYERQLPQYSLWVEWSFEDTKEESIINDDDVNEVF